MTSRIMAALHGGAAEPALKKLRNRLLAVNLVSLTLVIAVSFSVIYFNFYNRTQSDIDNALLAIPRGVLDNVMLSQQSGGAANSSSPPAADAPSGGQITISGEPRIPVDYTKSFVVNIANNGSITVFSMLDMDNDTYLAAIESVLEAGAPSGSVSISDRIWRFSIDQSTSSISPYKYSIVYLDIQDSNRWLGALAASLFVIGIIAVGAIFLISLFAANRAIRPVEESMIRQRRFVADASHELKTPIAVIAANAEAANDAAYEVEKRAAETGGGDGGGNGTAAISRWIGNIADEATRMGELVESLLTLAKAEEKQVALVPFDLVGAVCEEADRVEAFLFEKDISFDFELKAQGDAPLTICSDRPKVQAAISVLLENAVKYTPEKGRVTVTISKGNGSARAANGVSVAVSNTGAYIQPDDLAQIFDRFFRADPSRSSETGGHGIGLSIAKEIARTLGGELTATSVRVCAAGQTDSIGQTDETQQVDEPLLGGDALAAGEISQGDETQQVDEPLRGDDISKTDETQQADEPSLKASAALPDLTFGSDPASKDTEAVNTFTLYL